MADTRLNPVRFRPLAPGRVRPEGWLRDQLRIQADGLCGRLDEFWPDVRDSRWFGGDSEAWERAPYWLDGLIPLAFALDDDALKAKVTRCMDYILAHQHADGWLGPRAMVLAAGQPEETRYDLWGQLLATKVLAQYHDATGDDRAIAAMAKALRKIDEHIDRAPLFNWGQFRWFEGLIAIWKLYERTGESWLVNLAVKLHGQGFDWTSFFARWPMTRPTPKGRWSQMSHVVNNAMALKAPALWWRLTGVEHDRAAAAGMIDLLERHHGTAVGVFTGDECLAGASPAQGTELCAVVEYMFSLEVLLSVLGEPAFGDRLERIAFNALPATFSPDMWAHQYDQQVNQVECSERDGRNWTTNGPEANLFGVEPGYGCCTANCGQGWPKLAAHLWMEGPAGELAAVAYAPSRVDTQVAGAPLAVTLTTDYPFGPSLRFEVQAARPARSALLLRIPAWAQQALVRVGGAAGEPAEPGTFHRVEREWRGRTEIELTLPMRPSLLRRPGGAVAVQRGPLVYALRIGEDWRPVHQERPRRQAPHCDWEVYPTTPWNYALAVQEATLERDLRFETRPVGLRPFSPEGAPVVCKAVGRRVPAWEMADGSALPPPASPVRTLEPVEELALVPYGCTTLRITEFPLAADIPPAGSTRHCAKE